MPPADDGSPACTPDAGAGSSFVFDSSKHHRRLGGIQYFPTARRAALHSALGLSNAVGPVEGHDRMGRGLRVAGELGERNRPAQPLCDGSNSASSALWSAAHPGERESSRQASSKASTTMLKNQQLKTPSPPNRKGDVNTSAATTSMRFRSTPCQTQSSCRGSSLAAVRTAGKHVGTRVALVTWMIRPSAAAQRRAQRARTPYRMLLSKAPIVRSAPSSRWSRFERAAPRSRGSPQRSSRKAATGSCTVPETARRRLGPARSRQPWSPRPTRSRRGEGLPRRVEQLSRAAWVHHRRQHGRRARKKLACRPGAWGTLSCWEVCMRKSVMFFSRLAAPVLLAALPSVFSSCGGSDESTQDGTGGGTPWPDGGDDVSQGGDGAADVSQGDDAADSAQNGDAADAKVDVKPDCELAGASCATHSDCCSANCDPTTHVCSNPVAPCKAAGEACAAATECCTTVCANGVCGSSVCISDHEPCLTDTDCCSGRCGQEADAGADAAMVCVPLSTACSTLGNVCATHDDCCSHLCTNQRCAATPSFCTQTHDACAADAECCTGLCHREPGATLGACVESSAPGATGCTLAGEVCGGGTTGTDGGLPVCGGECCGRSCAPWGPSGIFVCQPPSGCRPTGEACRDDSDCCGSPGMPGGNGSVHCSKAPGEPVGRCDNGNACRPAGAVCKLATSSCNAENNCCAGNVNLVPTACQQDLLGIPRCTGVGDCADAGDLTGHECATSADCCGLPCVPNSDPNGPPFVCGDSCVPFGAACTTDADCCAGIPCILEPGSTQGVCGQEIVLPDGGATDGAPTDGPAADAPAPDAQADGGTPCALYGQACKVDADCCNDVPCTNGHCYYPVY